MNLHSSYRKYILLLVILCCAALLGACHAPKTIPDTAEMFKNIDLKKYTICDTSGQFSSDSVVSAYKLMSKHLDVEYYVLPTTEQTKRAFMNNRTAFQKAVPELAISDDASVDEINGLENVPYFEDTAKGSNFERYCLVTEDTYYAVSRVENSLVYIVTKRKYLKDANDFMRDINYY